MNPTDTHSHSHSRFDSPQQEAFLNLWRTYDTLKTLEESCFAPFDLSAQQYNSLRILRQFHPRKIHTLALAGKLVTRAPDITRLIDRLEKRELVTRERPGDNRRVVLVGITGKGIALLKKIDPLVQECNFQQLGHLSAGQLNSMARLLKLARAPHEKIRKEKKTMGGGSHA